jgi:hypothetical protein
MLNTPDVVPTQPVVAPTLLCFSEDLAGDHLDGRDGVVLHAPHLLNRLHHIHTRNDLQRQYEGKTCVSTSTYSLGGKCAC